MGMFHSTSGKEFYSPYSRHVRCEIRKETLKQILIREDELRFSKEYLEKCDKAQQEKSLAKIRDATIEIQDRALKEFGFEQKNARIVLYNARHKYRDDPEMNRLTVYMRHDHSERGNLIPKYAGYPQRKEDYTAPDAALVTLNGEQTSLTSYLTSLTTKLPVVILSGSLT